MKKELARMKAFGKAVRRVRQGEGWKQKDAAKKIGISPQHLCNIENGTYVARGGIETADTTRKKIGKFFGIKAA